MRIVCISDTHGQHGQLALPEGDVLIHAGDFSKRGHANEIALFNDWMGHQMHTHKIVIAGNHDFLFERDPSYARLLLSAVIYLEDSGVLIDGVQFWGSPVSPRFFDWAFNRDRGADIRKHWDKIPQDTDVLITHGPPHGILDWVARGSGGLNTGCKDLQDAIEGVQPRLFICGHIHEGYGTLNTPETLYVNASSLDEKYAPVHAPIVVDLFPFSRAQVQE